MPSKATDWLQFVAVLVVSFNVPLADAWECTVKEFWAIMDMHLKRIGMKKDQLNPHTFTSVDDVKAMEDHLRTLGVL